MLVYAADRHACGVPPLRVGRFFARTSRGRCANNRTMSRLLRLRNFDNEQIGLVEVSDVVQTYGQLRTIVTRELALFARSSLVFGVRLAGSGASFASIAEADELTVPLEAIETVYVKLSDAQPPRQPSTATSAFGGNTLTMAPIALNNNATFAPTTNVYIGGRNDEEKQPDGPVWLRSVHGKLQAQPQTQPKPGAITPAMFKGAAAMKQERDELIDSILSSPPVDLFRLRREWPASTLPAAAVLGRSELGRSTLFDLFVKK